MKKNPFTGIWYIARLDRSGMRLTRRNAGPLAWEFTETSAEGVYQGVLREYEEDRMLNETFYTYDPTKNLLSIDRSDVAPDGFVWICCEDRYRVEIRTRRSIRLRPRF